MKNNKRSSTGFYDFALYPLPGLAAIRNSIKGEGQRSIFIIYRSSEDQAATLEGFLNSIFNAAAVNLPKDAYLLNLPNNQRVLITDLYKEFAIDTIFAFGIRPAEIGIQAQFPSYLPVEIDQKTYLFADDIARIHEERQQKGTQLSGALWKAIRQLFKKQHS